MNQLSLLRSRQYLPFFLTQFFGAFNDNVFKNILILGITYQSATLHGLHTEELVALCAGVFILPFFLFSAMAGQIADKFSKTTVIKFVKFLEIVIMLLASVGFITDNLTLLVAVLFFMGMQSTFFGPAKYSILPSLISNKDLTGGNALVETGTFIAILIGTIGAGLLVGQQPLLLAAIIVGIAALGWFSSLNIPKTPPANSQLEIKLDPIRPLWGTYKIVRQQRSIYLAILAISWFWFIGASFLTLLPTFGKTVLSINEDVVTLLLSTFCIGIAVGAMLCEKMGGRKLELGLVPFGSIGLTLVGVDLYFASSNWTYTGSVLLGLAEFWQQSGAVRICVDFALLALFGGFYTVPLYTLVQERSDEQTRSQVIAGNNIVNAGFMVGSAIVLMVLPGLGVSIPEIFLAIAIVNALVAAYIYTVIPEYLLRFVAWIVANIMYRIRVRGIDNIPETGPAVIVANHVTFIDWLILSSITQRPIRFVMYHGFFKIPIVKFLFRDAKVIPIAPAHEDSFVMEQAFEKIKSELEDDAIVCIFPEGKLTKDGTMNPFKNGIERILAESPVPVIPVGIQGLWGSYFSKSGTKPFARRWSRVNIEIGENLPPETDAQTLYDKVHTLAS